MLLLPAGAIQALLPARVHSGQERAEMEDALGLTSEARAPVYVSRLPSLAPSCRANKCSRRHMSTGKCASQQMLSPPKISPSCVRRQMLWPAHLQVLLGYQVEKAKHGCFRCDGMSDVSWPGPPASQLARRRRALGIAEALGRAWPGAGPLVHGSTAMSDASVGPRGPRVCWRRPCGRCSRAGAGARPPPQPADLLPRPANRACREA